MNLTENDVLEELRSLRQHVDKRFDAVDNRLLNVESMLRSLGAPAEDANVKLVERRIRDAVPTAARANTHN